MPVSCRERSAYSSTRSSAGSRKYHGWELLTLGARQAVRTSSRVRRDVGVLMGTASLRPRAAHGAAVPQLRVTFGPSRTCPSAGQPQCDSVASLRIWSPMSRAWST